MSAISSYSGFDTGQIHSTPKQGDIVSQKLTWLHVLGLCEEENANRNNAQQ